MALRRRNQNREMSSWNPGSGGFFPMFSNIQREIDRIFDRTLQGGGMWGENDMIVPPVDIIEEKNSYIVRAELPGINKEDVKITLSNDMLTIRGEKLQEEKSDGKNFHRMERMCGYFERTFTLPAAAQGENVEATYEDGILTVTIPKSEESRPREIEVKMGGSSSPKGKTGGKGQQEQGH